MKNKVKTLITLVIVFLSTICNPSIVKADNDGSKCEVGIFSIGQYKGTGSPVASNLGSPTKIADSLKNAFKSGSAKKWSVLYDWRNNSVWSSDFTRKHTSSTYPFADNCDLIFYIGHGVKPGKYGSKDYALIMNNNKVSYYANQGDIKLGKRDCEWFITLTCNFLNGTNDQVGRIMEGLHTVCGFQTQILLTSNAGDILAKKLKSGVSVKESYFAYAKETQPGGQQHVAAVFTTTNLANDRITGYGSVGSDPKPYSKSKTGYKRYYYRCNWSLPAPGPSPR